MHLFCGNCPHPTSSQVLGLCGSHYIYCCHGSYLGKKVMFDCGIHPGYSGMASLPYLDDVDLSTVDVMLITHFHLDHCCAVPYVVGHTNFRGRIFMTHPTKAIFHTLLQVLTEPMSCNSVETCLIWKLTGQQATTG